MKPKNALLIVTLIFFSSLVFAETGEEFSGSEFVPGGFDVGLPSSSFAAPEYVAQQKFVDEMTTVYTWISANSSQFIQGCREDREVLETTVSNVIQQAQEASSVCIEFQEEAADCNPDLFCSRFESGLPIPPDIKPAMREAGYNPDELTLNDFTQELALNVCKAQFSKEMGRMKQEQEKMKERLRSQIPEFRKKCEEFKKYRENEYGGPRLPDFDFFPSQHQQPGQRPMQQNPFDSGNRQPQPQDFETGFPNQQPQQYDREFNDEFTEGFPETHDEVFPPQEQGINDSEIIESQPEPVQEQQQEPTPEPVPQSAPEPAPEATTSPKANPISVVTGFVFILNFEEGDTTTQNVEEPPSTQEAQPEPFRETQPQQYDREFDDFENDFEPRPGDGFGFNNGFDQRQEEFGQPSQGFGNQQDPNYRPQDFGSSGPGSQDFGNGQQDYGQRGSNNNGFGSGGSGPMGHGPSPEQLCEMSDDELVESFLGNMPGFVPKDAEIEAKCKIETKHVLRGISELRLGVAKCRANVALDCAAKQEAANSCNGIQENPESIAKTIVNSMCRRFGINVSGASTSGGLYDIASEFYEEDPALANQLGDTADSTTADQKKLNIFSYIIGDGDYSQKSMERADKLRGVRERITQGDIEDESVIEKLDKEIEELESESDQFGNIFEFGRFGKMFR